MAVVVNWQGGGGGANGRGVNREENGGGVYIGRKTRGVGKQGRSKRGI